MSVHQCPRCSLRFSLRTELDDHLRVEHPSDLDDDLVEFDRPQQAPSTGDGAGEGTSEATDAARPAGEGERGGDAEAEPNTEGSSSDSP